VSARLDVVDVTVRFGPRAVLDRLTLSVEPGEIVALLGPSGSGKSTVLRVVAGLVAVDSGRVLIDGIDVTATPTHRRGVGMVFQDDQLFNHLDVSGNIAFGLRMRGEQRSARAARTSEMLALVGLSGFGHRGVSDLSGGEAKRVALARSLAPSPRVLLLDEPLSGLDRELHDRLVVDLGTIMRAERTTSLLVTHDVQEAEAIADRAVSLLELGVGPAGPGSRPCSSGAP
jgi:thiamine transport system ATP-binding protein